ncbi:hypothetical protein [Bradyrhizobium roseum]|uniref:hypothetical protein n=1 Tax=Bradyrhizobium roseum TaxID=3056648 RepID=UPI0026302CE3|nr:hypothetical protein [Bradyrhizobium roseus]WKA29227.1 hypothetical protein QUH67_03245 [Bradyrhizobium roseus]
MADTFGDQTASNSFVLPHCDRERFRRTARLMLTIEGLETGCNEFFRRAVSRLDPDFHRDDR